MNADDRGPGSEAKPPFAPASGEAPVRREGFMPPSGSVPQRTAFRPVTGVQSTPSGAPQAGSRPTAAHPTAGAPAGAPRSVNPQAAADASRGASYAPASYAPVASAPATAAPSRAPQAAGRVPAPDYARPAAGTAPVGETVPVTAIPTRSATGAFGVGRSKDALADKVKASEANSVASGAPRKVRVLLSRIDPWSALKIGFLLSIAVGIMTVVAAHILWNTLNAMDTFVTIQEWVTKLFGEDQEVNIIQFVLYPKVMSATLLISVVNVALISGLSVVTAFIYNMISRVVGGVYVTLTDD